MADEEKTKTTTQPPPTDAPQNIKLEDIHDLPGVMVRKRIDRDLGGLVQSIKSQGVMEPVVLRQREDGKFQMVSGYRRLWGSELAGKTDIPALVRAATLTEAQEYFRAVNGPNPGKVPLPGKSVAPEAPKPPAPPEEPKPKVKAETPATPERKEEKPITQPVPKKELGPDGLNAEGGSQDADSTANAVKKKIREMEAEAEKKSKTPAPPVASTAGANAAKGKGASPQAAQEAGQASEEADSFSLPLSQEGKKVRIKISEIHDFPGHPYKVVEDKDMKDLAESIRKFGIMENTTVIPRPEGGYYMVSGHRRKHAALLAGLTDLPAEVKNWDMDEAIIAMVDSNLKRETISPMEKARAYKMKLEAMKRKSGRRTKEEAAKGAPEKRSDQQLAEQVGESRNTIQRFVRLNELVPDLQELVDSGKLPVNTAVELSFVPKERQEDVADMLNRGHTISGTQAAQLKEVSQKAPITPQKVAEILDPARKEPDVKIVLTGDRLRKYFPDVSMTPNEIMESVYGALEERRKREIKRQRTQEKGAQTPAPKREDKPGQKPALLPPQGPKKAEPSKKTPGLSR